MKIVVIGGMSRLGSKVVTILKQNAPQMIAAAQDGTVDTVSDDCLSGRTGITDDAASPSRGSAGCSGKDCARCSSCAAIGKNLLTDLDIRQTGEPVARGGDREARYCGIRLTDLLLLPDYRAIRDTITLVGSPVPVPVPRKK